MIIRRFLQWAPTAAASERAEAAGALARAYLYCDLAEGEREEARLALTGLLDDASPLVRRAMAESFASAAEAPHNIVLGLADDQSDISSIVLCRSPLLSDSDLIDCAAIGDAIAQSAIALRTGLSAEVAAALAEVGAREALISLAINPGADLPEFSMRRMIERFGSDGEVREALLSRPNLPASLHADLVAATADSLSAFVTERDWMSQERARRVTREACEQAHVIIAAMSGEGENGAAKLVARLRASGQLTASLLLRALLSGNSGLLEAALAELSDLPLGRIKGLIRDWRSTGFAALYRKAGLPDPLLPAFRAAIETLCLIDTGEESGACLSRQRIERVLTACKAINGGELDRLLAVLRRFDAEAAREEARDYSAALPQQPAASALAGSNMIESAVPMPEEPPLLLVDCDAESAQTSTRNVRQIEARLITVDLAALERELAAA
ncbi:MAG TPA: DUF2336 domain-containing protein [Methylovirgula sp.]|nr:DUF2336 domain-containing protein [Methylovirgula sp.]